MAVGLNCTRRQVVDSRSGARCPGVVLAAQCNALLAGVNRNGGRFCYASIFAFDDVAQFRRLSTGTEDGRWLASAERQRSRDQREALWEGVTLQQEAQLAAVGIEG